MLPYRVSNAEPLIYESGALPIVLRGPVTQGTSCKIISKSRLWLKRSYFKVFLFLALAAILFNGAARFEHFW